MYLLIILAIVILTQNHIIHRIIEYNKYQKLSQKKSRF